MLEDLPGSVVTVGEAHLFVEAAQQVGGRGIGRHDVMEAPTGVPRHTIDDYGPLTPAVEKAG